MSTSSEGLAVWQGWARPLHRQRVVFEGDAADPVAQRDHRLGVFPVVLGSDVSEAGTAGEGLQIQRDDVAPGSRVDVLLLVPDGDYLVNVGVAENDGVDLRRAQDALGRVGEI